MSTISHVNKYLFSVIVVKFLHSKYKIVSVHDIRYPDYYFPVFSLQCESNTFLNNFVRCPKERCFVLRFPGFFFFLFLFLFLFFPSPSSSCSIIQQFRLGFRVTDCFGHLKISIRDNWYKIGFRHFTFFRQTSSVRTEQQFWCRLSVCQFRLINSNTTKLKENVYQFLLDMKCVFRVP